MANYDVTLFNSNRAYSCTVNYTYIKLVGEDGESARVQLPGSLSCFILQGETSFTVPCDASIGNLVLIELDKQLFMNREDNWFPDKVEVKSPEGKTYSFPVYRWFIDNKEHRFREGKALKVFNDNHLGKYSREQELKERAKEYCWNEFKKGLPHCMKAEDACSLPCEVQFSFTKEKEFYFLAGTKFIQSWLDGLTSCEQKWDTMDEICRVFHCKTTEVSKHIHEHWMDDELFGYQFLNGLNPMMIQRCSDLPNNFPVTDEIVSLHGQSTLADEMKNGNIFLCDYKILKDVKTNTINGKKQYLTAPLVLLQKTPDDKMMPIAIQLKQKPAEDNPIFVPEDSEYDWLLAKIFVRSADANVHQLNFHLLRTHLLSEVFAVSLLRNLPMVHPLYKLLIPHTRYTLQINFLARKKLISEEGIFTKYAASGGEGMITILKKSLSSLTYRSLCMPDDIADRELENVPDFYYRDDGLRLWKMIHRFVKRVLSHYYKNGNEVQNDTELQKWVGDIFQHGFLSNKNTGIPQRFTTVAELIKFVTMVIFTGSAQHAAVNSGQYDFGGWMPNSPLTLQLPPPTKKGDATKETMLATFPDVNATIMVMDTLCLLSDQSSDFVALGNYPEDHFTEGFPLQVIEEFQGELKVLSTKIQVRKGKLGLQYSYLDPDKIENSVSI